MLSPRAVALQGLGYSPRLVAMQGLVAVIERTDQPTSGGGNKRARAQRELAARNNEIIMAVIGIVTSEVLEWHH